jgi:SAM-dependent methyltransferase
MAEFVSGFLPAQVVGIAAELGIADLLAREPLTAEQLGAATHTEPRALFRVLRYLASLGALQADASNRFSLTPMGSLLRSDAEGSMRPMARIMGRLAPQTVSHLLDGLRSGKCPFEVAFGEPLFEYLSARPEDAALFDAAMNGFHGAETGAVLDAYDLTGIGVLADIGCGNGTALSAALKRYPALRGLYFDQAHVLDRARSAIQESDLKGRGELVPGSFFESVPAGADAYFLRHIIHDWTDELSLRILGNIRRVASPTGRLLIVESIVPEGNDPSPAKGFDLLMMLFPNGIERTEKEYRDLLKTAGFRVLKIVPTASSVSVIEARPE